MTGTTKGLDEVLHDAFSRYEYDATIDLEILDEDDVFGQRIDDFTRQSMMNGIKNNLRKMRIISSYYKGRL